MLHKKFPVLQEQSSEIFCKKDILKYFAKFTKKLFRSRSYLLEVAGLVQFY